MRHRYVSKSEATGSEHIRKPRVLPQQLYCLLAVYLTHSCEMRSWANLIKIYPYCRPQPVHHSGMAPCRILVLVLRVVASGPT